MRRINKSEEPQSLRSFNKAKHENWTEISDPANRHVYNDCWQQCFEDQACLCSYTEAPLPKDKDKEKDKDEDEVKVKRHIDHYIKRDFAPDLTFCWNNMIAAVKDSRFGADYKDKHVKRNDYDKSEWLLYRYSQSRERRICGQIQVFCRWNDRAIGQPRHKSRENNRVVQFERKVFERT